VSEASAVPIWAGLLVAFVVLWEQRPLASIGLRPLGWHSLAWGVVLWLATSYAAAPLLVRFIVWLGLGGFDHGLARVLALPLWYRVLAVVTAGVVEETLSSPSSSPADCSRPSSSGSRTCSPTLSPTPSSTPPA
jgi:hypothetical protein